MIKVLQGDCFDLIKDLADNSVDLVITSPPYSDIINYGKNVSIKKPQEYVHWIMPLFNEIWRVLKPSGSFILNINDKTQNGLRSTYIFDLISQNGKEGKLKLYDTYIWHKKNGIPNGGPKRFRNTTEYIFHFCKDVKQLKFYMDRVLQEQSQASNQRYKYDMTNAQGEVVDGVRVKKKVKMSNHRPTMIKDGARFTEVLFREMPDKVRPDNVFRFSTAAASRDNLIKHPAPFNKELPLYFVNLLTDERDLVLDPFSGIGTTGLACKELSRNYIGFELNEDYVNFSIKRIAGVVDDEWVVNQYDLDGNLIKSHSSPSSASKDTDLRMHDILKGLTRDGFNTIGGFIWRIEKK